MVGFFELDPQGLIPCKSVIFEDCSMSKDVEELIFFR